MPSVLDAIVAAAWKRVEVARERRSLADLERALTSAGRVGTGRDGSPTESRRSPGDGGSRPSFADALTGRADDCGERPAGTAGPTETGIRVIAECKRRSPSKGILRAEYDPVAIAGQYAEAGAAAVSVLTEPGFFDGALAHLVAVRAAHPALPLLRKDFTIDEYQIAEAAVAGASAVLLIVAALEQAVLVRMLGYAADIGIDVLTEVHDEDEARRAIDAGATIVGVNNRNLKTLAVSIETSHRVAPIIASAQVRVAESGLRNGEDLVGLQAAGYGAFLIGERFMTEPNPGDGLARVIAEARAAVGARS